MHTGSGFSVRRATPTDATVLASLRFEFRSSLSDAVEPETEFLDRCAKWMHVHLADEAHWRAWILEGSNGAVGTVWLQLIEKLPNPIAERELHAYVTNLFVRSTYRGRSGGSSLLAAALADCEAHRVDTVVLWPTPRSRSLYERYGFSAATSVMARAL